MITTMLKLSENVVSIPPDNEVFMAITPRADKSIIILDFIGEAAFNGKAVVRLVWKYNHLSETEENIWIINGAGKMLHKKIIPASDVDGIRKLALVLNNTMASDSVFLSGEAIIKEGR